MRNLEVFREGRRRWRGGRSRHIDLGEGQRPDMRAPGQQRRWRKIDADIVQGNICAVAVADLDPFDGHVERHDTAEPLDRHVEIRTAYRLSNGPRQPGLSDMRLQQPESRDEAGDRQTERGAEPKKHSSRAAH